MVKIRAALLEAHAEGRVASDIDAGDLAAMLTRASITLVAEAVEDNPAAADMIDLGVGMGQGNAFSPPRPVKPEVFAEPEPEPAASTRPEPAAPRPSAAVLDYPQPAAAPAAEAPQKPERLPFRSVLRRASA